jgi:hypothetical protein
MKNWTAILGAFLTALIVGPACWWVGHRSGMHESLGLEKGTLVGSIDALQKLRNGDVDGGTRRLEKMCFLSADLMLGDSEYALNSTVKAMVPELLAYRNKYRTNSAEWTPAEERLQALLLHN